MYRRHVRPAHRVITDAVVCLGLAIRFNQLLLLPQVLTVYDVANRLRLDRSGLASPEDCAGGARSVAC